jgi:hypothetical protein
MKGIWKMPGTDLIVLWTLTVLITRLILNLLNE